MTARSAGFTLVELLVALSLFAMISVASLVLLRSSIDTQAALAGRIDRTTGLERVRALIADGLLTAQPQALRGGAQALTSAFVGTDDRMSFFSVAPGSDGGTAITRLTLTVTGSQLVLDRGEGDAGGAAVLIDDLAAAAFRYRGADGNWQSSWTPTRTDELPRAAELTVQQRGRPEVLMRFIVAPDWPAPDLPVPEEVPA
jgi:general secretion pathway protein J